MVVSIPPPNHGTTIYLKNLLNSKLKEEFEIHHCDTSDHRDLNNLSKIDIINIYLAIKNLMDLFIILIKEKPDLVYIPISPSFLPYFRDGLFLLFSKWFSKAKIVVHLHCGDYFRKEFYDKSNFIVKYFIKHSLNKADCAIVLSNNLKNIFKDLVSNVVVAYNGVDYSFISTNNIQNTKMIKIGYLGNILISKGIMDLIKAFEILVRHYNCNNIILEFAGNYWNQDNAKELISSFIKTNKLSNKVFDLGFLKLEEKEFFLQDLDIFVFLSYNEGMPLVLLEAMAAGLPIVASNVGSIPEIVVDGENGFIVEKNNPQEAARVIMKLIENPELRKKMGKAGREKYEEHFTLDKNITSMIDIFNQVMRKTK